MSRREHVAGKHGQILARSVLSGMGFQMIEEIGTPMRLIPVKSLRSNVYQVIFGEKVAGDHRALLPNGRSVLIEVKTIYERNLVWSDLREHQPAKLSEHDLWGGLSLLVWVHDSGVYVMMFPVDGFGPGKGITAVRAAELHEETKRFLAEYMEGLMEPA